MPICKNIQIPQIDEYGKGKCDKEITLKECTDALLSSPQNKTPGNDGLPFEFYKHFWDILGQKFIEVVKDVFLYGNLSISQNQAVITLIEKEGKERTLIDN